MNSRTMNRNINARTGFTLIELLVVVAIIAVLVSLLIPALHTARQKTRQVTCLSQLRQWGLAMEGYLQDNHDRYLMMDYGNTWTGLLNRYWYQRLINQKYLSGQAVCFCPADIPDDQSNRDWMYKWGLIGYGLNFGLHFDYGQAAANPPYKPVQSSGFAHPSQTIEILDCWTNSQTYSGLTVRKYFAYGAPKGTLDFNYGQAYPAHHGGCNVLWVDQHAGTVFARDPDPYSYAIYAPDALTNVWMDSNYWDRE